MGAFRNGFRSREPDFETRFGRRPEIYNTISVLNNVVRKYESDKLKGSIHRLRIFRSILPTNDTFCTGP